jgi:hypothetical protein
VRQREALDYVKYVIAPLRGAIGRHQDYFPGAMAAHVAGPSSQSIVVNSARTSEQLQDPRKRACRGGGENRTRPLAGIPSLATSIPLSCFVGDEEQLPACRLPARSQPVGDCDLLRLFYDR